jgi:hypothetical protein
MAKRSISKSADHPASDRPAPGIEAMLVLARKVTEISGCPVVGGIAVALHGWARYTGDIDIYSSNFWETHQKLEAAGIMWNAGRREHLCDGIAVHMVPDEALGGPPKRVSTIKGVRVIGLADLIRGKLIVGLEETRRAKDIADVIELIRVIPLKKDFASKLPTKLRAPFKRLVDEVHEPRRTPLPTLKFFKTYGNLAS